MSSGNNLLQEPIQLTWFNPTDPPDLLTKNKTEHEFSLTHKGWADMLIPNGKWEEKYLLTKFWPYFSSLSLQHLFESCQEQVEITVKVL